MPLKRDPEVMVRRKVTSTNGEPARQGQGDNAPVCLGRWPGRRARHDGRWRKPRKSTVRNKTCEEDPRVPMRTDARVGEACWVRAGPDARVDVG